MTAQNSLAPVRNRHAPFHSFKNIRTLPSGYQVSITRQKMEFSKHFAGHSEKSRRAAFRWRDRMLRKLPDKRLLPIPRRVLAAVGLKKPVVGVFRQPERQFYHVIYPDENGRKHQCTFSYRDAEEEIQAYRMAMEFRRSITE